MATQNCNQIQGASKLFVVAAWRTNMRTGFVWLFPTGFLANRVCNCVLAADRVRLSRRRHRDLELCSRQGGNCCLLRLLDSSEAAPELSAARPPLGSASFVWLLLVWRALCSCRRSPSLPTDGLDRSLESPRIRQRAQCQTNKLQAEEGSRPERKAKEGSGCGLLALSQAPSQFFYSKY